MKKTCKQKLELAKAKIRVLKEKLKGAGRDIEEAYNTGVEVGYQRYGDERYGPNDE